MVRCVSDNLLLHSYQLILEKVNEGIHIIDDKGITHYYNAAMTRIEGMQADDIVGKHILDVYKGWTAENSTLLTALKTGKTIHRDNQQYLNKLGKAITTVNTTMPIIDSNKIIGAIEIAQNVTEMQALSAQVVKLRQQLLKPKTTKTVQKHYCFDMLVGNHPLFLQAIKVARRAALSTSSVMIYGDTGTGKELFAQSIHYESERRERPFIAINCAALPETLLESILFGTVKGSFTGAENRPGLFEQAHLGTLFLDEINSMSQSLQSKILRVLQEGYLRRVGGLNDIAVDVRIIAATNVEPLHLIEQGELRKDLYYRINVLFIHIPSISERPEDIKTLLDYFIGIYNQKLDKDVWMVSEELLKLLECHNWKGNVRELQNFVESCLNMVHDDHVIKKEHLSAQWHEALFKDDLPKLNLPTYIEGQFLNEQLNSLEMQLIKRQFYKQQGNISKTAKQLGISRQNLQYKLKKYKITYYE